MCKANNSNSKSYYKAPWVSVYDPELLDVDYRVLMLIIERTNKMEYFNKEEYTIDSNWLSSMTNHSISEIVDSVGRLKKAGYLNNVDDGDHYSINCERIEKQATEKMNWAKKRKEDEENVNSVDKAVELLEKKGGAYAQIAEILEKIKKEEETDNFIEEIKAIN